MKFLTIFKREAAAVFYAPAVYDYGLKKAAGKMKFVVGVENLRDEIDLPAGKPASVIASNAR